MDGMKVMRKRLLTLIMILVCSLGCMFACGDPYEGLKIEIDAGESINLSISSRVENGNTITEAETKTIVITVVGKAEVSKEIDIQGDEKVSISKEFKEGKNYVTITPRIDGESIITVMTKEGNIKNTITVNISKGITGLTINNTALNVNGGSIDFGMAGDQVLTFTPQVSNRNIQFEFDYAVEIAGQTLS